MARSVAALLRRLADEEEKKGNAAEAQARVDKNNNDEWSYGYQTGLRDAHLITAEELRREAEREAAISRRARKRKKVAA